VSDVAPVVHLWVYDAGGWINHHEDGYTDDPDLAYAYTPEAAVTAALDAYARIGGSARIALVERLPDRAQMVRLTELLREEAYGGGTDPGHVQP